MTRFRSIVINRRGVVPGSSENSFLFHRISGNEYGMQMPPTGALRPEQIQTIKNWIDQGAEWPDSLANEADLPPLDPKAVAMVESLRAGNLKGFLSAASDDPKLLNTRGPEGSTPFMYAVLYASPSTLEKLLELGADSNKPNDAKATALMWAAADFNKTRLLLQHGADVNARSSDMRTPLMIAARRPGNSATVKLLLDRGAKPNPNDHPAVESSPLTEAATAGDAASVELLLSHGADAKAAGEPALAMAVSMRCALFRNMGRGLFKDVTYPSHVGVISTPLSGWSVGIFDFDNDGWKDVFVADGDVQDNTEMLSSGKSRQQNLLMQEGRRRREYAVQ